MANIQLTQELVKSLFDYKDGFLYWKIKSPGVTTGMKAGFLEKNADIPRYRINIKGRKYMSATVIFLYHNGFLPIEVDHIDRNCLNDRIENLREANRFQNSRNTSSRKNSTSKYLGVSWNNNHKKWVACIQCNHKKIHLGCFVNEKNAAMAYNTAASKYFGEFANLNII